MDSTINMSDRVKVASRLIVRLIVKCSFHPSQCLDEAPSLDGGLRFVGLGCGHGAVPKSAVLLRVPVGPEPSCLGGRSVAAMRGADAFEDTAFLGLDSSGKRDPYRLWLFGDHLEQDAWLLSFLP